MKDRQVEVVGGGHAVARVGGAVVLVGHRGPGLLNRDSPAAIALESLAALVREAGEHAPHGHGAQVAREATRWLMKHAEQISPGVPIDLGILSPAETGGVAIFLHGAVTAVVAEDGAEEHFRGSDAAFTVDRVAAAPARAVAIFVDDDGGAVPQVPKERGIGWLVEGIAEAAGAIVWSAETRSRTSESGAARRAPLPTARIESGPAPAEGTAPRSQAATAMMNSAQSQQVSEPIDLPETRSAQIDPHHALTEVGGTNPAPQPDPDLQRRLEATAKATALTIKVLGFKCARAHPSDPRSAFCTVCGMPVDQTQPVLEVIRPPLGMLVLDDGMTYMLAADAVLGRDPEHSDQARRGLVPLRIEDSSGGMSRAHAEVLLVNWDVTLVDRGSTNGTRTRLPGYRDWVRLHPNQPMILVPGTEIMIGNRVLRFEQAAPPPFGR
ncbi:MULTISPECIES: FHA domain-containing protein [unclassified Nocardia]|uniref:FHA domain-containing protein n=1 Tax=unclassified Nocardia TaxID=2637762 RepID=UPI001CE4735E|nr:MULTISPECIES: FHA domain-containing protein [unclassified Nocardia]